MPAVANSRDQSFAALRRFAAPRSPLERCELCAAALAHEHSHLLELASRQIVCACEACSTLFVARTGGKSKRVSRRALCLAGVRISDAQWEGLLIPINMAFFSYSSSQGRTIALYPSPAGAVESLLSLDMWSGIVKENPILNSLEADTEALLVNRVRLAHETGEAEYYLAPIDECYKLVGLIRTHWKGLSGGNEVWIEIAKFFAALKTRAEIVNGGSNA